MTRTRQTRRPGESGFALLLVFLMAAMIAISLYREVPRLAFESQRSKEELLIERGEQYKRAIQLFVRKMNRYPGKLEELENTNNIRFLRKRYIDPMTGKEEWRLIHCGPGGVLTDSVNTKAKDQKKDENRNTFIGENAIIGATATTAPQASLATRRRASEGGAQSGQQAGMTGIQGNPGIPGLPGIPGQTGIPGQAGVPGMVMPGVNAPPGQTQQQGGTLLPGQQPTPAAQQGFQPVPIIVPGQPFQPGQQTGTQTQTGGSQSQPYVGGQPYVGSGGYVGSGSTGSAPSYPGAPVNSQTGGAAAYPTQGYPVMSPGAQQPGMRPVSSGQAGQNDATRLIQQILTSPRPGGMPTSTPGMVGGGTQIGGGIAGVASTLEQDAIMVYDEHQKYNEWEFIYDPAKDRTNAGAALAGAQVQGQQGGKQSQSGSSSNPIFTPQTGSSGPR